MRRFGVMVGVLLLLSGCSETREVEVSVKYEDALFGGRGVVSHKRNGYVVEADLREQSGSRGVALILTTEPPRLSLRIRGPAGVERYDRTVTIRGPQQPRRGESWRVTPSPRETEPVVDVRFIDGVPSDAEPSPAVSGPYPVYPEDEEEYGCGGEENYPDDRSSQYDEETSGCGGHPDDEEEEESEETSGCGGDPVADEEEESEEATGCGGDRVEEKESNSDDEDEPPSCSGDEAEESQLARKTRPFKGLARAMQLFGPLALVGFVNRRERFLRGRT